MGQPEMSIKSLFVGTGILPCFKNIAALGVAPSRVREGNSSAHNHRKESNKGVAHLENDYVEYFLCELSLD